MEQHAISSDLIRGHIDTIILHTLLSGDKYAQQISEAVEEKSGGDYKINQATLYSSLKRLENLKYVNTYWNDSISGRRKYFRLTDSGKNTVEYNLSSWSYSRAIIDKLMDCAPQPVYQVKYIEKFVPMNEHVKTETSSDTAEQVNDKKEENIVGLIDNCKENNVETKQDINFRNILNGLIKSTTVQSQQADTENKFNEDNTSFGEEVQEKLKFNVTLSTTDYNAQKENNNGKIDFGDITLMAAKDGYKVRISSKDSTVSKGTLLINKLNAVSSVILLLFMILEFTFFCIKYNTVLQLNAVTISTIAIFILSYPTFCIIKYLINANKSTSKQISADIILTSAIIVFNLLLITFAGNLLGNIDFSDIKTILLTFVIPSVLYLDVFAYYVIKYFLSKTKFYTIKVK